MFTRSGNSAKYKKKPTNMARGELDDPDAAGQCAGHLRETKRDKTQLYRQRGQRLPAPSIKKHVFYFWAQKNIKPLSRIGRIAFAYSVCPNITCPGPGPTSKGPIWHGWVVKSPAKSDRRPGGDGKKMQLGPSKNGMRKWGKCKKCKKSKECKCSISTAKIFSNPSESEKAMHRCMATKTH